MRGLRKGNPRQKGQLNQKGRLRNERISMSIWSETGSCRAPALSSSCTCPREGSSAGFEADGVHTYQDL
eukprot:4083613-Amphidinium_carterae.1